MLRMNETKMNQTVTPVSSRGSERETYTHVLTYTHGRAAEVTKTYSRECHLCVSATLIVTKASSPKNCTPALKFLHKSLCSRDKWKPLSGLLPGFLITLTLQFSYSSVGLSCQKQGSPPPGRREHACDYMADTLDILFKKWIICIK
jgi:hypothetical protein